MKDKWFILACVALAVAAVYFRYEVVASPTVRAAYVLDRITGTVKIQTGVD